MPTKTRSPIRVNGSMTLLTDGDWITVIAALLHDSARDSRQLAERLLLRSKQGRQIRLARLIRASEPTLTVMARRLKVSRRTIFRYLNGLEEQGVQLDLTPRNTYRLRTVPRRLQRVL